MGKVDILEPAKNGSMRELGVAQKVDYKGYGSSALMQNSSSIYNIRKQTKEAKPRTTCIGGTIDARTENF